MRTRPRETTRGEAQTHRARARERRWPGRPKCQRSLRHALAFVLGVVLVVTVPAFALAADEPRAGLEDAELARAIERALDDSLPTVDPNWVDVAVKDGVVTLDGRAPHLLARERTEMLVLMTKGVRGVVNRLEVTPPYRDDEELAAAVRRALVLDSATDALDLDVEVEGSVVTLRGVVDSWAERELAREAVMGVRGVAEVENELTLSPPMERPDDEIRADVEGRLRSDVWIDAALVDVSVNDGEVTLTGVVGSAAEKVRAVEDAWVAGVDAVSAEELEIRWWAREDMQRRGDEYLRPSDGEIARSIEDALRVDPRVSGEAVDVSVDDGFVALTGTVESLQAKDAAAEDAENTLGVWRVKNYLKVRYASRMSDEAVEQQVREMLANNPYLEGQQIEVSVRDGAVSLDGSVDSSFHRNLARRVATRTNGVTAVENRLSVRADESVLSDWELAQDVEARLEWSPFLDGSTIDVSVDEGVVTLDGSVATQHAARQAVNLAFAVGAEAVINHLDVAQTRGDGDERDWGRVPLSGPYYPVPYSG